MKEKKLEIKSFYNHNKDLIMFSYHIIKLHSKSYKVKESNEFNYEITIILTSINSLTLILLIISEFVSNQQLHLFTLNTLQYL